MTKISLVFAFTVIAAVAAAEDRYIVPVPAADNVVSIQAVTKHASGKFCIEDKCYMLTDQENAEKLLKSGAIGYYEQDTMHKPNTVDPLFSEQWEMNAPQIGWKEGEVIMARSAAISPNAPIVAVIDTGYTPHEDLEPVIYKTLSVNDNASTDFNGHGTHVAGTIAAVKDNGLGISGAGYGMVRVMPVKAYNDSVGGFYSSDLIKAINLVLDERKKGANIVAVNMSYGGGGYNSVEFDAMTQLYKAGIVVFAAAGNSNSSGIHYPSSYPLGNIVAVAAIDDKMNLAYYTNYGPNVDIASPGSSILSLGLGVTVDTNIVNYTEKYTQDCANGKCWVKTPQGLVFEQNQGVHTDSSNFARKDVSGEDLAAIQGKYKAISVKYNMNCADDNCTITLESITKRNAEVDGADRSKKPYGYLTAPMNPSEDSVIYLYMTVKNAAVSNPYVLVTQYDVVGYDRSTLYNRKSGTSMATPFTAGIYAAGKALYPKVKPAVLVNLLLDSAANDASFNGRIVGNRRIDVKAFLENVENCKELGSGCAVPNIFPGDTAEHVIEEPYNVDPDDNATVHHTSSGGGGCSISESGSAAELLSAMLIVALAVIARRKFFKSVNN